MTSVQGTFCSTVNQAMGMVSLSIKESLNKSPVRGEIQTMSGGQSTINALVNEPFDRLGANGLVLNFLKRGVFE